VYVGSENHNIYAFNAATGATQWTATTGDSVFPSLAVANGVVYASSADDNLYAFNAATGAILWTGTTGSYYPESPTVADGVVYVSETDGKLYAYALNGGNNAVYKRSALPPPYASLHPDVRLRLRD
jgi:outer membrane protein assembly factor BamB